MYYHITSLTNDIIASNLPPELWSEANRCVNVSVSELCPIKNKKKRHGVIFYNETTCKIYVPLSAVSSYKYRESWSKYASQIEGYDFE